MELTPVILREIRRVSISEKLGRVVANDRLLFPLRKYLSSVPTSGVSVGVVLVGFTESDTRASVQQIRERMTSYAGEVRACLVLNRHIDVELPAGWVKIVSSNAAHEFSGFDEGLARLIGFEAQTWLLCNDRLVAYDQRSLQLISASVLRIVADHMVLLGHTDQLLVPVIRGCEILGNYVRTNLVCLSERSRSMLGSLTSLDSDRVDDLCPPGWPFSAFLDEPPLVSSEWLACIAVWLTGVNTGSLAAWYRATQDKSQAPFLRLKAVAIANEQLLSERFK